MLEPSYSSGSAAQVEEIDRELRDQNRRLPLVRTQKRLTFRLSLRTTSGTVGEAVSGAFGNLYNRLTKNGMQEMKAGSDTLHRGFRVRANDVQGAQQFLEPHWPKLAELRNKMGRFSLEYEDDMLTLSFADFAPIDVQDCNGVRRTGLPSELSVELISESARQLDFLSAWLENFLDFEETRL